MGYPSFSAGDTLAASDMNAVGLWLVKSETAVVATNASPKQVLSVFSSTYRNYRLECDWTQTTANGELQIQFFSGTSTLYNSATYNYAYGGSYVSAGPVYGFGAFAVTNPFAPATAMTIGFAGTGYTANAWLDLFTPNIATSTRFLGQNYTSYTGVYYNASMHGSGGVETTTQFTGFRFIPTAGTSTINYRLYGYRD